MKKISLVFSKLPVLLGIGVLICLAFPVFGQHHPKTSEKEEKEKRYIHHNNFEVFLGETYFTQHHKGAFTVGFDYEHRFDFWNRQIGVGLLMDYEFGTEEIPGAFLVGPSLIFFPFGGNFKLFTSAGAGITGRDQEMEAVLLGRIGGGFEIDIHHQFLVVPTLSLDFTKVHTAVVGGVALGLGI